MLFFGKCCVQAFYFRMFEHMNNVRYQIHGAFVFASAVIVASILMPVWVETVWKADAVTAVLHTANLTVATGIIKLVLDLVILYIPIPVVVGMNLLRAKKIRVLATFLTGSL